MRILMMFKFNGQLNVYQAQLDINVLMHRIQTSLKWLRHNHKQTQATVETKGNLK